MVVTLEVHVNLVDLWFVESVSVDLINSFLKKKKTVLKGKTW